MPRFEYCHITVDLRKGSAESTLNKFGEVGWEVCGMTNSEVIAEDCDPFLSMLPILTRYCLKRQIPEPVVSAIVVRETVEKVRETTVVEEIQCVSPPY